MSTIVSFALYVPWYFGLSLAFGVFCLVAATILTFLEHGSGVLREIKLVRLVEDELAAACKEAEAVFFDGELLTATENPWKDWREKVAHYLGKVFGATAETKFLAAGIRMPLGEFVRRDIDLLIEISEQLQADAIRLDQKGLEEAAELRRENGLMKFQPIALDPPQ